LLLDEPLSDLDIHSRLNLQDEIIKVYQKTKITTILVSHDLSEVFKLSKKILSLIAARSQRSGSPQEVFVNNDLSGKFKFTGEIIDIQKDGVLNILTLSIGNNVTKVVASDEEIAGLAIGSKVIVAAKAFNPESSKLIKYFLASLTIPEKDLWVNLSHPYEKDRMIARKNLGQTEMGRDMLAQDYILKQLTASLIYPESI
jgi:ABC-type sulfate/molybdate transport systems ATPase subunit